uniref:RING-type domain-containing protein n=1 Tax=Kalanchoe fedtschenkoi TaxID=63787 RepID=A0A7N1A4X6_KALFE
MFHISYGRCTVCLADYHEEDTLRILPFCGHSFHVTCIDIWLYRHSTCPICRVSMRENAEKRRSLQPMFSSAIRAHYGMESMGSHSYQCFLRECIKPEIRVRFRGIISHPRKME